MPPKNHETEIFIELGPGKAIRVRITMFEEGMPTPGEAHVMRKLTSEEAILLALHAQSLGKVSLTRPF